MTGSANILQVMDDPAIFGPFFKGDTWAAWRAFLAALFGLPMDDAQLALYRTHTGRTEAPKEPFKEAALVVGRRGGKSRTLALAATYLATSRDYAPHLGPGEVATVAVIASGRQQARVIFNFIRGMLRGVPELAREIEDESSEAIVLRNRVAIEIHTASFRVTRGYTFAAVLADETAFWRDESSANPDVEIFRALRPGLASIPGAILLNASSPYRKAGVLYNTFKRNWARDDSGVLVWRGTTLEMNPGIDATIVDDAYADDPQSAAAEYGAEFRDDIADFVSRDSVEACVVPGRKELLPASSIRYVAFVDPSGGSADSFTLAIAHADKGVAILDAIREVRPPFSPEQVVADFAALLKTYRVSRVTGDRYAGEWPREQFRKVGVQYDLTDRSASDIYRDTLPLLNSGKVELLDLPRLTGQLCALERRTSRMGKDAISHPVGGHDDVAVSAAGALLAAGTMRGPIRIPIEALMRI